MACVAQQTFFLLRVDNRVWRVGAPEREHQQRETPKPRRVLVQPATPRITTSFSSYYNNSGTYYLHDAQNEYQTIIIHGLRLKTKLRR